MIKKWTEKYNNWALNGYLNNDKQMALFRILYALLIIVVVGVPQFSSIMSGFPSGIFNPPPLFGDIFSSIPPLLYFQITDVIILLGFFLLLIGLFTRISGVITSILIIVNYGFIFSTGKIDHSFLVWFFLLILSFSGWQNTWSLDAILFKKRKSINNWTISLLSMVLGFSFFTAGFIKLISGWLSFSDSMLRAFYLRNFYVQQKQDLLAPLFENFNFFPFWESGDWFTIIFEVGFFLVIFRPKVFRFYTLLAIFFHGMVLLMMNIGFYHYIILYFLFWMPLVSEKLLLRGQKLFEKISISKSKLISIISFLVILYFANLWINNHPTWLKNGLILVCFIGVFYIFIFHAKSIFKDSKDKQSNAVIRFDGVCNLCNGFVQFVINRDKSEIYQFAPLQDTAPNPEMDFDSIILEKNGLQLEKSDAFLEIVRRLDGFWSYIYLFIVFPKPIRDIAYTFIAKNRYRFFGKKDACMIPTPEMKKRFL